MTSTLEITDPSANWAEIIRARLRAGDLVSVRFESPFMTPEQMANSIGITRQAIMRRIKDGKIKTERRGNRYRIPLTEVERFRDWYLGDIVSAVADEL
jgi:excisionase family DNA binding protein